MARAKTATSRAGSAEAGLTLLEVVVVMVLLGLSLLLVAPRLAPLTAGGVEAAASEVARELLAARDRAVAQARVVRVAPERLAGAVGARGVAVAGDVLAFFPDGGASGGRVTLTAGQEDATIEVDALTGTPFRAGR